MKIAVALLALLGLANAQIPLVAEVIREVTEEIIYDDAPMRERMLPEVPKATPLVDEVIRQGSEEIIYNDPTFAAKEMLQEVDVSVNGMRHGLNPDGPLPEGHEKASHLGVPRNVTKKSTHFKDPSQQERHRRHRRLLDIAADQDPAEEVRVLVGHLNPEGKTLTDEGASVIYEYIEEINVSSVLLTWGQVIELSRKIGTDIE
jgi:hypothetical protein